MSAIEQALRQIDEQAKHRVPEAASTEDRPLSRLAAPLPPPEPSGRLWTWVLLGASAVMLLSGGWALGRFANLSAGDWAPPAAEQARPTAPSAQQAMTPRPAEPDSRITFVPDDDGLDPTEEGAARPDWLTSAAQEWTGGLKDDATRMWSSGLRSESPARLALMLAEQLALTEADALYQQWAQELPLVVLKHPHQEPSRWMVLVVPAAPDMEGVREKLVLALGPRVQWGSISEWLARLALLPSTSPAKQVQETEPINVKADKPSISTPLSPAPPPTRAQTPVVATTVAPTVPAVASNKPPEATREKAPLAAPDIPEIRRTTTSAADPQQDNPVAARAINIDFETLEKQLAEGQHAAALDGVSKLEKVVGENWRTRYLMGVALSGLGRWPEAATALTEARRKNPGHVRLALYLSVVQQELGEHTGSIATLLLIQEKHPEVPEVWLNQGISYQALGRSEDARTAYQRFLDLSSGRAEMQAQREWVLGQIGNVK